MLTLKPKQSVEDVWPMTGKRVFVRVDFNVPMKAGVITNDYRIRSAVPTIRRVIENGGICILCSHLGRPTQSVRWSAVQKESRIRALALKDYGGEQGSGKTSFFTILSGEDKLKILGWSSKASEGEKLGSHPKAGKTTLFASLPEEEKKRLVDRFCTELKASLPKVPGYQEEFSLRPVANRLRQIMEMDVHFAPDCMAAESDIAKLKAGEIILLENCRFYADEDAKSDIDRSVMSQRLASYADIYISDAFGTAHRNSASMTGVPHVLGHGAAGYLMKREVDYFSKVLNNPKQPVIAIVGGAKVSDKIQLLENMLPRINKLLIGGAMAYTFLKAQGKSIGSSRFEDVVENKKTGVRLDLQQLAADLVSKATSMGVEVLLPIDHVCHERFEATDAPLVTDDASIPDGFMGLDIGPKTISSYRKAILDGATIIWNGPMGVFEMDAFSRGTFAVAKALGDATEKRGALSIIGGGDSASAAEKCGQASRISHVSTGGGASLELLEGKSLPGLAVLDDADAL